ncbi:acetyl-coenzyme A carboxylase carboxyl transferase subunit beta [Bacillus sp. J14TS2]|uniref:acetyl-CoA carboxylase, carboxyltransferase subunit beta n=1 Tax=Bacillus sp. J14TS2 TaxID=2807188 RepID=UPI001B2622AC|nr:acetyl-CoA carboxylase, carboxyltransferase subunit beta [Bacillus sp. J14TS2]GIN72974.1 acetyl-coenzyme A carboxylase carboxyl transferase subunit beta [Bacillus sp. J14TS2]
MFKKKKFASINNYTKASTNFDKSTMVECPKCKTAILKKEVRNNLNVCTSCDYHFRLNVRERIKSFLDDGIIKEFDSGIFSADPLDFPGYKEKLESAKLKSGLNDAIITGEGKIGGFPVVVAVMGFEFFAGTMGSVVGERIVRAIKRAKELEVPLIIFSTSGGARMQESIFSLMQMAKTSAAIGEFNDSGGLYISIITDQTFGGVSASFAMLGDYIFAEPHAVFGFAGRRVSEQVIQQKLPSDFQTAEFYLEHGQIDGIIHRKGLKEKIIDIIDLHINSKWNDIE